MKQKPVIMSLEQVNCDTCIYSNSGENFVVCCRKAPTDSMEDAIKMLPDEFCGEGMWIANDGDDLTAPQRLPDIFYIFHKL
jgi:hypothetical protein